MCAIRGEPFSFPVEKCSALWANIYIGGFGDMNHGWSSITRQQTRRVRRHKEEEEEVATFSKKSLELTSSSCPLLAAELVFIAVAC